MEALDNMNQYRQDTTCHFLKLLIVTMFLKTIYTKLLRP